MAKSKLIAGRSKKSTVLVSVRTLQDAITRANMAVEQLSNPNDPQIEQVENAVQHMTRILKANPQQMRQDGVSSISDYMDDAVKPEEARKLKNEVDMILKIVKGQRNPQEVGYVPDSAVIQHGADQYPSGSSQSGQYEFDPNMKNSIRPIAEPVHASKKQGNGAGFTTDRDEKGEAKAPEKLEVPRLAKKKKEAVPEPAAPIPGAGAATPEPVPAPAPAGVAGGGNPIDYIPTETLIKVIGDLPKEEDFPQNKGKQDAVIQLTEILKQRPVEPPEQAEGAPAPAAAPAPPLPVAASSKKADLGDHAMGDSGNIGGGSSPSHAINPDSKPSSRPSVGVSPAPKSEAPASPQKATVGFGGLEVASSLEEKTADDYRIQDYKLTEEGVRPSGRKPNLHEQEEQGVPPSVDFPGDEQEVDMPGKRGPVAEPMYASVKVGVTPPGISEELMHKLKKEYPGDKEKAYATAWSIHNKKESAKQAFGEYIDKIASYGGGWNTSYKPMEVDEDGGRTPEIAEAHAGLEDNTGIDHPETVMPIKLNEQQGKKSAKVAAEMTSGKAVKQSETLGNDLKKMYLDAKSLTTVNDTRAVREAVESIFRAADMFDEATKALNKQHQQEESEAAAAEVREKSKGKKSSLNDLALAAAE